MKRTLLLLSFLLSAFPGISQCVGDWDGNYTFDDTTFDYNCYFWRDTTSDTNNIWQIGHPNKAVFSMAASLPNAIVTDTMSTYPANDTSSFVFLKLVGSAAMAWHWNGFDGHYNVNSDTLDDYGTIEFSPDNGATWIDILNDTSGFANWDLTYGKPVLSGNSFGWRTFSCVLDFSAITSAFYYDDTLQYRFTFYSDSVETHKDGLMFDDLGFFDTAEGIIPWHQKNRRNAHIFPNPANDKLHLKVETQARGRKISITNSMGQLLATYTDPPNNEIDIHDLPPGMYLLHYTDAETNEVHRFSIQR